MRRAGDKGERCPCVSECKGDGLSTWRGGCEANCRDLRSCLS